MAVYNRDINTLQNVSVTVDIGFIYMLIKHFEWILNVLNGPPCDTSDLTPESFVNDAHVKSSENHYCIIIMRAYISLRGRRVFIYIMYQ